ncbi:MAG: hypothetical protein LBG76_10100 [Treponema sp.]|nr:hypothetical protein [Treponema sp.]
MPRIAGLLALYAVVFVLLGMIQLSGRRNFTRHIDSMTISGHYSAQEGAVSDPTVDAHFLTGEASVYFGGMEFRLGGGLGLVRAGGEREELLPEYLIVLDGAVIFRLSQGAELIFAVYTSPAGPELRITGNFTEDMAALEIPFVPLRSSRIRNTGEGAFVVSSNGINYSFESSPLDAGRGMLLLKQAGIAVSYGAIQQKRTFVPDDYLVPEAREERYREVLAQWRDNLFASWSGSFRTSVDENLITAYVAEAASKGNYGTAVAAISPEFRQGNLKSFQSSVYLGSLDAATRLLSAFEEEQSAYLARLTQEESLDYLKGYRIIDYCGIRGYEEYLDRTAALLQKLPPEELVPALVPGILEGCIDWNTYRSKDDNPFTPLVEPALALTAEGIRREKSGGIFAVYDAGPDLEFNLRLGLALDYYGSQMGRPGWAGLGRSVVLSCLAQAEPSGDLPRELRLTAEGDIQDSAENPGIISAAGIYRYIAAPAYPHAARLSARLSGVWAWTAALDVQATLENNVLDIAVTFPEGETHYMMIRGIPPFSKIQLYNMDYQTDPKFESYNASGWSYTAAEQGLLLKMKHRQRVEHITIYYPRN